MSAAAGRTTGFKRPGAGTARNSRKGRAESDGAVCVDQVQAGRTGDGTEEVEARGRRWPRRRRGGGDLVPAGGARRCGARAERGPENEKPLISQGFFRRVVPRRGLEPPRFYPLVPETSASTNSATWAYRNAVGAAGGVCCVAARRLSTVLSQRRLNTGIGKAGRPQARFSHVERGLYRQRTARARQMRIGAGRRRAGR